LHAGNIPLEERAAFLKKREEIEKKFAEERQQQRIAKRTDYKDRGLPLLGMFFGEDRTGPYEMESMRQDRTDRTVRFNKWEYEHWFEGEPEDFEDRFTLTNEEREAIFDWQSLEEDGFIEKDKMNEKREMDYLRVKMRKKRRKWRKKFKITPQTITERKRIFRFKASNKWAKLEDAFWYAAFPQDALSHLEHDPQKILFPYIPRPHDEELAKLRAYERRLDEIDIQRADFNARFVGITDRTTLLVESDWSTNLKDTSNANNYLWDTDEKPKDAKVDEKPTDDRIEKPKDEKNVP